jgi:hypothetical protein
MLKRSTDHVERLANERRTGYLVAQIVIPFWAHSEPLIERERINKKKYFIVISSFELADIQVLDIVLRLPFFFLAQLPSSIHPLYTADESLLSLPINDLSQITRHG